MVEQYKSGAEWSYPLGLYKGNSITFGAGLRFRNEDSYPAQIQKMLGDKYLVKNYGLSGRTMTTSGLVI